MNSRVVVAFFLSTLALSTAWAQQCPELVGTSGAFYSSAVGVEWPYVYTADYGGDFRVFDVSSPSAPTQVGTTSFGSGFGLAVAGDIVIVAAYDLAIYDVSTPSSPSLVIEYTTPGSARDVAVSGGYAFVADEPAVLVIDMSDPSAPVELAAVDVLGSERSVAVNGELLFVGCAASGLTVLDVSTPSAPTELGHTNTPGAVYAISAADGRAYGALRDDGLVVFDVSDPYNPSQIGALPTVDALGVALQGSIAYVSDGFGGLVVIDVGDPAHPVEIGSYLPTQRTLGVAAQAGYTFLVGAQGHGLAVLDGATCGAVFADGFESGDTSSW